MEITRTNYALADPGRNDPNMWPNAANFAFEEQVVPLHLAGLERGLQVGCMDGTRVVSFSKAAPGVHVDGLEINETSTAIARQNVRDAGLASHIILGDIMAPPPELQPASYDLVYATNNTLGYLDDPRVALDRMRSLSRGKVLVSLFSDERFTDKIAREYFTRMKMDIDALSIQGNDFIFDDGNSDPTIIRRFNRDEVLAWGGKLTKTPLGFYALFSSRV
jgi:SAM-dependent methyltransferase